MEIIFCLAVIIGSVGCKKMGIPVRSTQTQDNSSTYKTSAAPVPSAAHDFIPPQGNFGTVTQCPVNKEKVIVGKNTPAAKYQGKEYYFCCPLCMSEFKSNPEKYKMKK